MDRTIQQTHPVGANGICSCSMVNEQQGVCSWLEWGWLAVVGTQGKAEGGVGLLSRVGCVTGLELGKASAYTWYVVCLVPTVVGGRGG